MRRNIRCFALDDEDEDIEVDCDTGAVVDEDSDDLEPDYDDARDEGLVDDDWDFPIGGR